MPGSHPRSKGQVRIVVAEEAADKVVSWLAFLVLSYRNYNWCIPLTLALGKSFQAIWLGNGIGHDLHGEEGGDSSKFNPSK